MLLAIRIGFVVALLGQIAQGEITLSGGRWDVSIHPETLAIEGRPKGGTPIVISSARSALEIDRLEHADGLVSWAIPAQHITATIRLEADVLAVDFESTQSGHFQWPVIAADARAEAYVLPMFEGLYVPANDEPWAKFLTADPLNTTAGLSMPFWGIAARSHTVTYILTNPFNNEVEFKQEAGRLGLRMTHTFTRNQPVKAFGFRIHLGDASPVGPAKVYRQHLIDTGAFVSLADKIKETPDVAKLLGAPHIYLWGEGVIARGDIRDYKTFAARLAAAGTSPEPSIAKRAWELLTEETRKHLAELQKTEFVDNYQKGIITEDLSRILKTPGLDDAVDNAGEGDDVATLVRKNSRALHAAFPDVLESPDTWGDGFSVKMVRLLVDAGIDRAWLGSPGWDGLLVHPEMVAEAQESGYLIGPYDSYHSMHPPGMANTWETAQFGQELYDTGAIVKADGTKRAGFQKKGYLVSPAAARPYVEKRVSSLMKQFNCNSWFIDCDAFGEVFDDYAPAHPMTQAQDAAERLDRMAWIRDQYGAVIGSEGGSAYAAPVIHFAHGIMTPVIGWGDVEMMKDKQSKYFVGGYYPPDQPAIHFKQVPLKEEYRRIYADPKFRLPLYQIVFRDSVIATHQWGYGSLKFDDPDNVRELLEMLYNVPPLFHLNLAEWAERKAEIKRRYDFFSPLHRETAAMPMSDFRWLTDDRMVQRVQFGDTFALVANFGTESHTHGTETVPGRSILLQRLKNGVPTLYNAQP